MSSWSPEDRAEYEALLSEAADSARTTHGRAATYLDVYYRALAANRIWARDVRHEAEIRMAATEVNDYLKRHRLAVAFNGKLIRKPRVIGSLRTQSDGSRAYEQTLFDFFTWDELEAKATGYLKTLAADRGNLHVVTRLLKLRDLAPETTNAHEAATEIGTTVEAWLAEDARTA